MTQLRVVLYAEGTGELGSVSARPPPGEPLPEAHLGPAHLLVRRALAAARRTDPTAIVFESPLRLRSGREPRGSDLHEPTTLRRLLGFVRSVPDMAIVLVDADGDSNERRRTLAGVTSGVVPIVRGIAVQEFEAWLVADEVSASRVLGRVLDAVPEPDSMPPGRAKTIWSEWTADASHAERASARLRVAAEVDLAILARRSRSFEHFASELRAPG